MFCFSGMFPYVMLCTTPMFCYPNWPRFSRLGYQAQRLLFALKMIPKAPEEPEAPQLIANERCIYDKETVKSERKKEEDQNEKTTEDAGAGGGKICCRDSGSEIDFYRTKDQLSLRMGGQGF